MLPPGRRGRRAGRRARADHESSPRAGCCCRRRDRASPAKDAVASASEDGDSREEPDPGAEVERAGDAADRAAGHTRKPEVGDRRDRSRLSSRARLDRRAAAGRAERDRRGDRDAGSAEEETQRRRRESRGRRGGERRGRTADSAAPPVKSRPVAEPPSSSDRQAAPEHHRGGEECRPEAGRSRRRVQLVSRKSALQFSIPLSTTKATPQRSTENERAAARPSAAAVSARRRTRRGERRVQPGHAGEQRAGAGENREGIGARSDGRARGEGCRRGTRPRRARGHSG